MSGTPDADRIPDDRLDALEPDAVCDGGNLDCGSGLLLVIRKAMHATPAGGLLEIRSTERSVCEDLPAWCRMTSNPYVGWTDGTERVRFFVRRGGAPAPAAEEQADAQARAHRWRARVYWASGMTARVTARNNAWSVGQPASFDVRDEAPSAVEHLLGALGGCLAMGLQMRASRKGIAIRELEVSLSAGLDDVHVFLGLSDEGSSGIAGIDASVYVSADADEDHLQRLWQDTVHRSPIASTLLRGAPLTAAFHVVP
jgi:uncharacterized OsmC-like protein/TusA-related sulfurtransferase